MCYTWKEKAGYLPIFYNGCNLKRVRLLGVKSPAFPVDSLQSRRKQRHQPVGLSTTGRPCFIHAKASKKLFILQKQPISLYLLLSTSSLIKKRHIQIEKASQKKRLPTKLRYYFNLDRCATVHSGTNCCSAFTKNCLSIGWMEW